MSEVSWTHDLMWWITAVELPAIAGLFLLIWRTRRELDNKVGMAIRDLAEFKLEVAKTYASQAALKETEQRLTDHLVRIEHKLDSFVRPQGGS